MPDYQRRCSEITIDLICLLYQQGFIYDINPKMIGYHYAIILHWFSRLSGVILFHVIHSTHKHKTH